MPARATVPFGSWLVMLTLITGGNALAAATPGERAIDAIRHEALLSAAGLEGFPLPLVASWNQGDVPTGFTPDYQIVQIERGQYLLPWFGLSVPRPPPGAPSNYPSSTDRPYYYAAAIRYLAERRLPLCFETTQFEALLSEVSPEYPQRGADGKPLALTPFGSIEPWRAVGRAWAHHPTLRRLQQLYPDPPLVLFVSNNERTKLSPDDLHADFSANASPELIARRRAIGDAWIERYRAMEQAWREALEAPAWRAHATFVGYDAFVSPAMGRWGGWPAYSLYVPGRTEPWPYAWDGATVSFYLHDWAPDADFIVWSPQIEAMNFVPVLGEVRRTEPDFWFELSVWDGQLPGEPTDKRVFYLQRNQEFTPARYGGMVQFGMWLLRPRVVREFRNPQDDRIRFGRYFDALLAAVARVHEDATLRRFWRGGRLLENPLGGHPYEEALPDELATRARWFLLDCTANPPRPWQLTTPLAVYALALEQGRKPHREWLVYAFSPQSDSMTAQVTVPGGPRVQVPAAVEGAFALVSETDGAVRRVGAAGLRPH
jgi:hypothetical protein